MSETNEPLSEIIISGSKVTVAVFAPISEYILTGHESGKIAKYDIKTREEVLAVEDSHTREITDIQLSPDGTYFITSSKDKTARVSQVISCSFSLPTLETYELSLSSWLLFLGQSSRSAV